MIYLVILLFIASILLIKFFLTKEKILYSVEDFPFMKIFELNYIEIKKEVEVVPKDILDIFRSRGQWTGSDNMHKMIEEIDKQPGWIYAWHPDDDNIVNKQWLNYPLYYGGHKFSKNLEKVPALARLLETVEDKINIAGLSLMTPHAVLPSHTDSTGPTYNSMAYHLGIVVPEGCFLRVKDKKFYEKNGKSIIFNSEYMHSAENNADTDRIILYIDFKI